MTPKTGDYILFDHEKHGLIPVHVTKVMDNDVARFWKGVCLATGEEITGGLYTDENFARIKRTLTEMEVLAWASRTTT